MIAYVWTVGVGVTKIISVSAPDARSWISCDCGAPLPSTSSLLADDWLFTLAVPSADLKP